MTITIRLKTDSAAFIDGVYPQETRDHEIRRIVHDWLHRGRMADAELIDENRNRVGSVTVKGK